MISVEQARQIIWDRVRTLPAARVTLSQAVGMILAEPVAADMEFPPFDRALMDGYAVRTADLAGRTPLEVIGSARAGTITPLTVGPAQAVQINTGAAVPAGADAVVMFEKTEPLDAGRRVRVLEPVAAGEAIMPRGAEARTGTELLPVGTRLKAAQLAVAASCGARDVMVYLKPRVAILATGDELVPSDQRPGPGQIRNSNSPQLAAMVAAAGARPIVLDIAPDDRIDLTALIQRGLDQADVLILTGGVSMGTTDFVPRVLEDLDVRTHFHKVAIKPGKPTLFGTTPRGKYVFGLPGNPVSTYVCFHFFVMALLEGLVGHREYWPAFLSADLSEPLKPAGDRQSYLPAVLSYDEAGDPHVTPTAWRGSGDPFGLARGNALIERPAGAPAADPGRRVRVYPLSL